MLPGSIHSPTVVPLTLWNRPPPLHWVGGDSYCCFEQSPDGCSKKLCWKDKLHKWHNSCKKYHIIEQMEKCSTFKKYKLKLCGHLVHMKYTYIYTHTYILLISCIQGDYCSTYIWIYILWNTYCYIELYIWIYILWNIYSNIYIYIYIYIYEYIFYEKAKMW